MKELSKTAHEIGDDLTAIDQFMFVLGELRPDELTKEIRDKIIERLDSASYKCAKILDHVNKVMDSSFLGHKRFDIMKSDGSIELGVVAESENDLRNIYSKVGENDIQVLREISEYGIITKCSDPHYPASMFSKSSFRSDSIDHARSNSIQQKIQTPQENANTHTEDILEREYEKFQNDPEGYIGPNERNQEFKDAEAEKSAVEALKTVREKDGIPTKQDTENDFLKSCLENAKSTKEMLDNMLSDRVKANKKSKRQKKASPKSKKEKK